MHPKICNAEICWMRCQYGCSIVLDLCAHCLNWSCNLIFMTVIQFTLHIPENKNERWKKKRMKKECLHLKTIWRIRRQRFYLWFDSCSFDFRWPQDDWPIENLDLHFIDRLKFNDQEIDRSLGPSTFRSALNVQINFSFFFIRPLFQYASIN